MNLFLFYGFLRLMAEEDVQVTKKLSFKTNVSVYHHDNCENL